MFILSADPDPLPSPTETGYLAHYNNHNIKSVCKIPIYLLLHLGQLAILDTIQLSISSSFPKQLRAVFIRKNLDFIFGQSLIPVCILYYNSKNKIKTN